MIYTFTITTSTESKFLSPLGNLIGDNAFLFHDNTQTEVTRKEMNGAFTVVTEKNNQRYGIVYNDFKINGGGFGKENSARICAFIEWLNKENLPLVFIINSMGVKITEGRSVFPFAFKIVPVLKKFLANNLLVTIASGSCLGLGALIFAAGDYKISIKDESKINLTGPEVFKLFFGEQTDFMQYSSGERMFSKTQIVDEICESKETAYRKTVDLLTKNFTKSLNPQFNIYCDDGIELFPQMHESIKTIFAIKSGKLFGLFINPPNRPNMLNVNSIKRFNKAIKIFKKLQLPLLSVVDTPGADPRIEENDKNIIGELLNMSMEIVDYPYPKKGLIVGRCFGGASIFSFPCAFGGEKTWLFKNANIGIMSNGIISQLLNNSTRLLDEWKTNIKKETPEFDDLQELAMMDRVIDVTEVPDLIKEYLETSYETIFSSDLYIFNNSITADFPSPEKNILA